MRYAISAIGDEASPDPIRMFSALQALGITRYAGETELTIDHRHHDTARAGRGGAIDDQQIAIMNALVPKFVPLHPHEERRFGMADQVFVQAQMPFDLLIGGRGEPGGNGGGQQGPAGRHRWGGVQFRRPGRTTGFQGQRFSDGGAHERYLR